eukprot:CAMPEP_0177611468 /NCGR_PEP_ID=MMETSP0419_2-20121207/20508_1 /TAXON_ID=582737 /ORGANISM="Tetraselmis sp., Strain GSL018" /LENGTH=30 /DNA_ID= /DNA_START= /DNA_END= /DNA_ORIENTATION=
MSISSLLRSSATPGERIGESAATCKPSFPP